MNSTANYSVQQTIDGYPVYELSDSATRSTVRICPERGGIMIGCTLHGRELLYLDRATFLDPQANIRGGNPVLFPICGQLADGQYEWEGRIYRMKNHGVARVLPWDVEATSMDGSASLTLVLRSSDETLASYPFDFELRFTYKLKDGILAIEQQYANQSAREMPMIAGFHPYFAAGGKNLVYDTDATELLDYNDGERKPFDGSLDLGEKVESRALLNAQKREIAFPLDSGGNVRLRYSEEFRYVVLWSVEGKPFICVEPWTALNEAFNRKEDLLYVKPGDALRLDLSFAWEE